MVFAVLVMVATSNAVNLTDGLDGLAAGSATFCFAVLAIMGYWIFRHFSIYHVLPASAIDLALASVALAGGCLGFLWWNAAPARIIMGDTGSLAIGSGLAALCLLLNLDLLLPILGGLFVLETLSVIAQVVSFRVFGRRVFRMAPFHHHFELLGWPETTVIVRFWILAGSSPPWPRHLLRRVPRRAPRRPRERRRQASGPPGLAGARGLGRMQGRVGASQTCGRGAAARRRAGDPTTVRRSCSVLVGDAVRRRRGHGGLGVQVVSIGTTARRGRSCSARSCGWPSAWWSLVFTCRFDYRRWRRLSRAPAGGDARPPGRRAGCRASACTPAAPAAGSASASSGSSPPSS